MAWGTPPSSTSFVVNSRALVDPQCPPESAASYLCHVMLMREILMTHRIPRYRGKYDWNMLVLGWEAFFFGSFVGFGGFLKTWLPFLIICAIIMTVKLV